MPIDWFGTVGYTPLKRNRLAKLELTTSGRRGVACADYRGFTVQILDVHTGPIDKVYFAFDDYLTERSDARSDYQPGDHCFEVVEWHWYIAVPATTRPFTRAVERYLDLFRAGPADDAAG